MRNHGANKIKLYHSIQIFGNKLQLDNVHAAILSYKMDYYEDVLERRREIAKGTIKL